MTDIDKHYSLLWHWINYGCAEFYSTGSCGLYYKPMTIVNDDARIVNKLEASLTDDARVVIYDHHMFIVQATGDQSHPLLS